METMSKVELAQAHFGQSVLLVPCHKGTKVPMQPYKHRPDALFHSKAWLSLFDVQDANVAVILGRRSGNLIAIDFDNENYGMQFDAANPSLQSTLRTTGSRGWQIWFWVDESYPSSQKTDQCEWRSDGNLSTFAGLHPSGVNYQIMVDAEPMRIKFCDIVWPAGWTVPSASRSFADITPDLIRAHGNAVFYVKETPVQINEQFWAGLYCLENETLFEPNESRFYSYNDITGLWETKPHPVVMTEIGARMMKASQDMNEPWLMRQRTSHKLSAIIRHLEGQVCKKNPFDTRLDYIHVANCVLMWRGDDFVVEDFDPQFYSRNSSPVSYVEGADCPRFKSELLASAMDADDAILLQKFVGMYLLGKNKFQKMLILEGASGTGKTQIAALIRGLVGEFNCANLRTDLLQERFELANYIGKQLLIGADVPADFFSSKGFPILKSLIGGDSLMAEIKGAKDVKPLTGNFSVLVTANCRLRLRLQDDTDAWRRRLAIITFKGEPPLIAIPDFGKLLIHEEGPGILNWAMDGVRMVFRDIKNNNGRLFMTPAQIDRTNKMLTESESLKIYLQQNIAVDPEADITTEELTTAYSEWCHDSDLNVIPENILMKLLPNLMLEMFHVVRTSHIYRGDQNRKRGYKGVKIKRENSDEKYEQPY